MALTADIITILNAANTVRNLVVTNAKTGSKAIRPGRLDADDRVTLTLGGIEIRIDENDFQNDLGGSGGTSISRVVCVCVSQAALQANNLADAVARVLEPFRGATAGGFIDAIELMDRREDWGSTDDGRTVGEYVVELEMNVIYTVS